MKTLTIAASILILAVVLAACSGSPPEPVRYTIDMTEYAFSPPSLDLKVGQDVELTLINSGQLVHEVMFGKDVMMMNNRPSGFQTDMFESTGTTPEVTMTNVMEMDEHGEEETHAGFMVALPQGEGQAVIKFKVTPQMAGEWEMGCFEQDGVHYDAGMKGKVTISR
ncbi:MAG: hypothetical protein J5I90_22155 [Caldilineales bacterium]|nr:hypothetical protein [Caldilineales bacterium]